jgi:hypothetical protein
LPSILRVIKSRKIGWGGHVTRKGENRKAYMLLVGKPEGKRPLGRPRCRWLDNIRIYYNIIILEWILERCNGVMSTGLA